MVGPGPEKKRPNAANMPRYEPPCVIELGALAVGIAAVCQVGSGATDGCSAGTNPSGTCITGDTAVGICSVGTTQF